MKRLQTISLAYAALLSPAIPLPAAAFEGVEANIVGGTDVTDRTSAEYRHAVRFINRGLFGTDLQTPESLRGRKVNWRCSGTLIHPRVVLTAAHCLPSEIPVDANGDGSSEYVPFAEMGGQAYFKLNSREDVISGSDIRRYVRHPEFNDRWISTTQDAWNPAKPINDIALVLLSEDAPSFKNAAPLPTLKTPPPKEGETITLAGYGLSIGAEMQIPRLRSVAVPFREFLKNGQEWYTGEGDLIKPGKVPEPHGACSGDSGGSAFRMIGEQLFISGIIIRGPGNENGGCEASVTILTDVKSYLPWISQTLSDLLR